MKIFDKFFIAGFNLLVRGFRCTIQHLVIIVKIFEIDGLKIFKLGVTDFKSIFYAFQGSFFRRMKFAVRRRNFEEKVKKRQQQRWLGPCRLV